MDVSRKPLKVTYDAEVDAAYIYLRDIEAGGVATTVPVRDRDIHLDFDSEGRLLGIELLSARLKLPRRFLDE
jgi:uncharacterized protein YuzE